MPEKPLPSIEAINASAEAARAHTRIDGHQDLCTERWRTCNQTLTEIRDSVRRIHERLSEMTARDTEQLRGSAASWRGVAFRWLGWGLALVSAILLAVVKLT
jgi:hypothetical protein